MPDSAPANCTGPRGDCDDTDSGVGPGSPEICDGKDNNCNGLVDDECGDQNSCDIDHDGYLPQNAPAFCLLGLPGDCDDSDPDKHPGLIEICDGKDNDCNNQIDDNCIPPTPPPLPTPTPTSSPCDNTDNDGDGASECAVDCDDTDPSKNLLDVDGDGVPSCPRNSSTSNCQGNACQEDCNDNNANINPLDADGDGNSTCDTPPDCVDTNSSLNENDADSDGCSTCQGDADDTTGNIACTNPSGGGAQYNQSTSCYDSYLVTTVWVSYDNGHTWHFLYETWEYIGTTCYLYSKETKQ